MGLLSDETPCTAAPCEHGGVCSVDGDSYTCACADGYSGNDCGKNKGHSTTKCLINANFRLKSLQT